MSSYVRPQIHTLISRLQEPRRFLQIVAGARQVGKTTLAREAANRSGLQYRYAGNAVRRRGSSPKLQVFNNALLTAQLDVGFAAAQADRQLWGQLVKSAIGAHLVNNCHVYYWRKDNYEVDYIATAGQQTLAIEVKSGNYRKKPAALEKFSQLFNTTRKLLVGGDGIAIETFLSTPISYWFKRDSSS